MILMNILRSFITLRNFLNIDQTASKLLIDTMINSTYGYVEDQIKTDLNNTAKKTYRSNIERLNAEMNRELDLKYNQALKEIGQNIVNKKIDKKTYSDRLRDNKETFKKDIKKIEKTDKKRKKKISKRVTSEYKKVRKIVKTEGHRVKEGVKSFAYDLVRPTNYRRRWQAKFINTRHTHEVLSGQYEDEKGYFYSESGARTKYPGGFGIAGEDINCRCYIVFEKVRRNDE